MTRTRIKICGITRPNDAADAARLGVDAIGLVFYPPSPRAVSPTLARDIVAALPPFVATVALFLDPAEEEVDAILQEVPISLLQFHGRESPAFCARFNRPWIKALGMAGGGDPNACARRYTGAAGVLVDGHPPGAPGGSGRCIDWNELPTERDFRLILAGGLTPNNIADAVQRIQPDAVDVSSGVESAKGCKDVPLMHQFIEEVQRGDRDARSTDERRPAFAG